jgi:hypothetical protein
MIRQYPLYGWAALVVVGLLIAEVSVSHLIRHNTLGKAPLDEWSARHRDLNLTTHNAHIWENSMAPVGF